MIRMLRGQRKASNLAWMLPLTLAKLVHAAPQGAQVVSGQAVIQQSTQAGKSVTTVIQSSPKATLNWQSFNVSGTDSMRFVQPDASSLIVNRISDPQGSRILGQISANGQVWLINPAGVYFGPGAQVNVGSLVASTLNLDNNAAPWRLQDPVSAGNSTSGVINQGKIQTTQDGYVALLGANVSNSGDIQAPGGRIVLLGDKHAGTVALSGRLDASGGQQTSSGFVETSAAHVRIADSARVDTRSADGSSGNWLIDPTNFTISSGSGTLTSSSIGATTLSTSLASSNVSIATDNSSGSDSGNIYVNSAVSWTAATTLSLSAYKDIYLNAPVTSTHSSGKLKLLYGQGSSSGSISGVASDYYVNAPVTLAAGVNFYTQLGSDTANLKSYQVITSLGSHGSTTGTDLQGMNGSLTTHYALGADIDASNTSDTSSWYTKANYYGFTKIGDNNNVTGTETFFSGTFAGLGHTVSNLYMYQPNTGVSGMFAGLSTTGVIRDTGLVSMDITTNSSGGLVGRNRGTVKNSFSTGSITSKAGFVGGLVGDNSTGTGTVTDSYSSASVIVSNSASIPAGGLVGRNYHTITSSYASGAVSGNSGYTGGLVGELKSTGSISDSVWNTSTSGQSSAYGSVSAGSSSGATGLSTSDMKLSANYSSWNFTTPWIIYSGYTAPLLRAFMTPLSISAYAYGSKVYDGTTSTTAASYTDPGSMSKTLLGSVSFVLDGSDVGTHSAVASGLYSDQLGYQISYAFSTNSVSITSSISTAVPNITTVLNPTASGLNDVLAPASLVVATDDSQDANIGQDALANDALISITTANQIDFSNTPGDTNDTSAAPVVPALSNPNFQTIQNDPPQQLQPASVSPAQVSSYPQAQHSVPGFQDSFVRRGVPNFPSDDSLLKPSTWSAEFTLNNHGSSYSGERQTGWHQQHRQVFKADDSLDLNLLISSGQMQFARWAYEFPWQDSGGLRLGAASSYLSYYLGGSAASLKAYGSAKQQSMWLAQPVWGTPQWQLLWRSQYDQMALHDVQDSSGSDNDRHAQMLHLGVSLGHNNPTGAGQQSLDLDAGLGWLGFNNATAQALDSATADTQGRFCKFNLNAGLQLPVGDSLWSLNWQSQWSDHNLDSAQKMSVGGANSVRAYAPGVLSGDNGQQLTIEFKQLLAPATVKTGGKWYAGALLDTAWLTLYRHAYASGANEARLSGSGLFLEWQGPDHWHGKITLSQPFGGTPTQLSGSHYSHTEAWLALSKSFQ